MIPKIVHTYWEGEPNERVEENLRLWSELNPGWVVYQHTRDNNPVRRLLEQFDNAERWGTRPAVMRSNMLRWEALWRIGGIWADGDMRPQKPMDELLTDDMQCFCGLETVRAGVNQYQSSIMGSARGSAFAESLVQGQLRLPPHPPRLIGVHVLVRVARPDFPGLTTFPPEVFYPYDRSTGQQLYDPAVATAIHERIGTTEAGDV